MDRFICEMRAEEPGGIRFTLEVTMCLDDWEKLSKSLEVTGFPDFKFREAIQAMSAEAKASFQTKP